MKLKIEKKIYEIKTQFLEKRNKTDGVTTTMTTKYIINCQY